MSPAVLLVRPPDKSVCQRLLLLLLWPKVLLLLLLLLVMEAVAWVRVETVLTADALEYNNHTVSICTKIVWLVGRAPAAVAATVRVVAAAGGAAALAVSVAGQAVEAY